MIFSFAIYGYLAAIASAATPSYNSKAFDHLLSERQSTVDQPSSNLVVDLGYARYMGVADASAGLHTWKGIRYAAPPTGSLRWQLPQAPSVDRSQILRGDTLPEQCPQGTGNAITLPSTYNFTGNEDCLFLNVYAPQNATDLPVLVWIHGGGYGLGQGSQDMSAIINANGNKFIAVAIQYRLGAFGFLSSDEVMRYGVVNAGLHDQMFALQWVQKYIGLFGGNASQVTISGQSSGGGSVMLHALAFGGHLGDSLFSNAIAASPYLGAQYGYADLVPSQSYNAFASAVGCLGPPASVHSNSNASVFQCLVGKDTKTLQHASTTISNSSRYGSWVFLPVTDGVFAQQLPSQQLLKKQVNGKRILIGTNADEGPLFTPQNVTTENDFIDFLHTTFPHFTDNDISQLLHYYPSTNASVDISTPKFATSGNSPVTAVNESDLGTGQQQRANNVYAETAFVCPAYWLAEAFTDTNNTHAAYKYQYSVVGAWHATDLTSYFGPPTPNQGPDFNKAFMTIWGNFITQNNPSISPAIANGVSGRGNGLPATDFPAWSPRDPLQLILNQTGGQPYSSMSFNAQAPNVIQYKEPGLRNAFSVANAYTWEGGRGERCDFWRSVGRRVPE